MVANIVNGPAGAQNLGTRESVQDILMKSTSIISRSYPTINAMLVEVEGRPKLVEKLKTGALLIAVAANADDPKTALQYLGNNPQFKEVMDALRLHITTFGDVSDYKGQMRSTRLGLPEATAKIASILVDAAKVMVAEAPYSSGLDRARVRESLAVMSKNTAGLTAALTAGKPQSSRGRIDIKTMFDALPRPAFQPISR